MNIYSLTESFQYLTKISIIYDTNNPNIVQYHNEISVIYDTNNSNIVQYHNEISTISHTSLKPKKIFYNFHCIVSTCMWIKNSIYIIVVSEVC